MDTNQRPLFKRAKFAGPFWCGTAIMGVFLYAIWNLPDLKGDQLEALVTIVTSMITALMTLGIIIGGGASVHDAAKDWGSRGTPHD